MIRAMRLFAIVSLAAALVLSSACKTTPKSKPSAQAGAENQAEINIGRNLMAGILGALPLVDKPELQRYINRVGRWVAMQSERPDLRWTFAVVDSPAIYAFSAPGGYVALTSGFYEIIENEDQLASVLARQISHIVGRHHLEALQAQRNGELADALNVHVKKPKQQEKIAGAINRALPVLVGKLPERFEYAADRQAPVLAARAGYDPYALLDILTTLASIDPQDPAINYLLENQPPLIQRLATLDQLLGQHLVDLAVPEPGNRLQNINRKLASDG